MNYAFSHDSRDESLCQRRVACLSQEGQEDCRVTVVRNEVPRSRCQSACVWRAVNAHRVDLIAFKLAQVPVLARLVAVECSSLNGAVSDF